MGILDRVFETREKNSGDDFWYAPIGAYAESKAGVSELIFVFQLKG